MRDYSFSVQPTPTNHIRGMVAAIFRRKLLIAAVFVGIFSLVAIATFLTPRRYESRMKVLIRNERTDFVVSSDARDAGQARTEVGESQVNSEIELLSSDDLLTRVVRACRLDQGLSITSQAVGESRPEALERAVRKLGSDLKITPIRKANIIQITYVAKNPQAAAAVLKELLAAYLDAHMRIHRSPGTTEFFSTQADIYRSQLHNAENLLSEFRRRNQLTSIAEQRDLTLRQAVETETGLREAEAAIAEASTRVQQLGTQVSAQPPRIVTQTRTIPNQNSVERLNTMLAELENRRTQSLMKFRPDDRVVGEIEQEIANTRAGLKRAAEFSAAEQATDVNPLRQSLEGDLARAELQQNALQARRQALGANLRSYRGRLSYLESASVDHDALQRAVKESEENYLLYAKKQEEARIADSLDQRKILNVGLLEVPVEHHLPASPNVAFNLALGVFVAAFISLSAAFSAEYAGDQFHTAAELEYFIKIPVLASIPYEKRFIGSPTANSLT